MRVAVVIGDVTLAQRLDCLAGGRFIIVQPLSEAILAGCAPRDATPSLSEPVIAYDQLSPGRGARVAISEGREAAMPFHPRPMPIDVYCAAVLDTVEVRRAS